jgi:hypothetical protein
LSVGAFLLVLFALRVDRDASVSRKLGVGSCWARSACSAAIQHRLLHQHSAALPLTLANAGVFHGLTKDGDTYRVSTEKRIGCKPPGRPRR